MHTLAPGRWGRQSFFAPGAFDALRHPKHDGGDLAVRCWRQSAECQHRLGLHQGSYPTAPGTKNGVDGSRAPSTSTAHSYVAPTDSGGPPGKFSTTYPGASVRQFGFQNIPDGLLGKLAVVEFRGRRNEAQGGVLSVD